MSLSSKAKRVAMPTELLRPALWLSSKAKRVVISTGLYRPARWLSRRIRPDMLRTHQAYVDFYKSLIPADALCFDVGANVGENSEALLRAGGRVVSFEPNPMVTSELRARRGHRENWSIVEAAVGSEGAMTTLYVREHYLMASLDPDWMGKVVGTVHVPVVTLDSAIRCFGRPDYCKIDVEGWELEVLNGLSRAIPLLSFEFHLTERDIGKTISCLQRLSHLGANLVNVTTAESSAFYFKEWMTPEQFLEWFPAGVNESFPGGYGDIFIKSHVEA